MKTPYDYLFREYDIRGRLGEAELNTQSVGQIARAYGEFCRRRHIEEVVLGFDNRQCSPGFAEIAIEGLKDMGLTVYNLGLTITPAVYFAQYFLQSPGAMMITASHNPDGWSGFKLADGYSSTLGPQEIEEIYTISKNLPHCSLIKGTVKQFDIRGPYLEKILQSVQIPAGHQLRVVVDAGNGGAGIYAWELFQALGCTTFALNCDPDDTYPHYFPNPSEINARRRLREMVTHPGIKADLGLGFDGDGDRLGVMDEMGQDIWSDLVLLLLSYKVLSTHPRAPIVFDVKCSRALIEGILAQDGRPIMWQTGHSHIKSKMRECNAPLAGERSGHIFIGGNLYYGYDDALMAGALLVEEIVKRNRKVSKICASLPQYITTPEIKAACPDAVKYEIVDDITRTLKARYGDKVNTINGARLELENGWGLVRASSNLPELVLVFEGKTKDDLLEIRALFREVLSSYEQIDSVWQNDRLV